MPSYNGRELTDGEWNLLLCTNLVTLRAACKGEGLPVSGTKYQLGDRLIAAGLIYDQVIERYGWQARSAAR